MVSDDRNILSVPSTWISSEVPRNSTAGFRSLFVTRNPIESDIGLRHLGSSLFYPPMSFNRRFVNIIKVQSYKKINADDDHNYLF